MILDRQQITKIVALSLAEDIGAGDISAALLLPEQVAKAEVISREAAVICGVDWVTEVFRQVDPEVNLTWLVRDGSKVSANQSLFRIQGRARSILTAERSALNWLQTLSGTATIVSEYKIVLQNIPVLLLDTRKTIPGLRIAQKYAVHCGGGCNHRMGLFDAYLIKDNHIKAAGSITKAVEQAKLAQPDKMIEIEVETLIELEEALAVHADIILLDNFTIEQMREAVHINQKRAQLEVSGNVTLDNIREIALTGVERISVGALTKHIKAIDLSLRFY